MCHPYSLFGRTENRAPCCRRSCISSGGDGGTVAKYMAKRNIDTLDAGVPVLSMHAPFETVAKLDCYMTYRGMKAIFEKL